MKSEFINSSEVMELLSISKSAFYNLINNDILKRYQIPNTRIYRFKRTEVNSLFQ